MVVLHGQHFGKVSMEKEYLVKTEQDTRKFRLLVVFGLVIAFYFGKEAVETVPTISLVGGYLGYALLLAVVIIPRFYHRFLVYGMILVDTGVAVAALYIFGVDSPIFIILPLVIICYAIYLGYVGSLASATILSVAYSLLVAFSPQDAEIGAKLSFHVPLLYLVALFAGYLGQARFKEREARLELQESIRAESGAKDLLDLAKTLHRSLDLDVVVRDIVRFAGEVTGIPNSIIFLWDKDRGSLVARAGSIDVKLLGVDNVRDVTEAWQPESVAGRAFASGQPVVASGEELPPWARRLAPASLIAVPVGSKDNRLGMLYLLDSDGSRVVTEARLRLAQGLGEVATTALGNALLHAQAEERRAEVLSELQGRVQPMRRIHGSHGKPAIRIRGLSLDPAKRQVVAGGKPLRLSASEFELLYYLAEHAGTPINQETLLHALWGEGFHGRGNVVDVGIHRLRKKLDAQPLARGLIRTVRGAGYMMERS